MGQAATMTGNGQSETEQLRWQIERQRASLGRDLEALGDHVSPGRMVERRKAAMGNRLHRMRERLMGVADDVGDRVSSAGGSVSERAGSMAEGMRDAPDVVMHRAQGSPLGMGLVTFGLGFVAAALFPATRPEERLAAKVEPTLDRMAEEAGSMAREGFDDMKPAAQQAAQDLREDAAESAQVVKDSAQEGARHIESEARSAAGQVRDEVQGSSGGPHPPIPPETRV